MRSPFRNSAFRAGPGLRAFERMMGCALHLTLPLLVVAAVAWTPAAHAGSAPSLDGAAETYRRCLVEDLGRALAGAKLMRERIEAGDADGAKRAWIDARIGWERSEVFTSGFVPDLDQKIDAWPNAQHGFHGIEAMLFGAGRAAIPQDEARKEADALVADLADLHRQIREIPLPPQRLLNGLARLVYEVGGNKTDGGESRLSGTSLNDMQSNADGIALAWRVVFAGAVGAAAPQLEQKAQAAIDRLKTSVEGASLRDVDVEKLRTVSEDLMVVLQRAAPTIGLDAPALEDAAAPWRDTPMAIVPVLRD